MVKPNIKNWIKKAKAQAGFTLIELLATLAILAVIVGVATPAIGNIRENAENSAKASSIEMIEKAAMMADLDGYDFATEGNTVADLIDGGYLDLDVSEGSDNEDFANDTVAKTGNGGSYEVTEVE